MGSVFDIEATLEALRQAGRQPCLECIFPNQNTIRTVWRFSLSSPDEEVVGETIPAVFARMHNQLEIVSKKASHSADAFQPVDVTTSVSDKLDDVDGDPF